MLLTEAEVNFSTVGKSFGNYIFFRFSSLTVHGPSVVNHSDRMGKLSTADIMI